MKTDKEKPVILAILDGWGIRKETAGNAVALAKTPNMKYLLANYPNAKLTTHGEAVGLPSFQVGNSEVGHMNLGSGRKMLMDLPRIDKAISEGFFDRNSDFIAVIEKVKKNKGKIHLIGLCSSGGVHSHQDHIVAALKTIRDNGLKISLHMILDGRDSPPKSALDCLKEFQKVSKDLNFISTISGRYYAMDRDQRWERTELFFNCLIGQEGKVFDCPKEFILSQYQLGVTDEFVKPAMFKGYEGVKMGKDGIIFMNFRADRIRQIAASLCDPEFNYFLVKRRPKFSIAASLVSYSDSLSKRILNLFPKIKTKNTLGDIISINGKKQLRLAETEKYAHVTYFFNCGEEKPFKGEDRILVKSPNVATYDLQPQMAIEKVTKKLVKAIEGKKYDFILVNFANPDMVGHTGKIDAAIKACEVVDKAVGDLMQVIKRNHGILLLVADHGNCEEMIDLETKQPHTAHTLNLVPVILFREKKTDALRDGKLADIAPTVLDLIGLEKPIEMSGTSLLKKR